MAEAFAYVVLAINPIGGLLAAIPFAIFKLGWPAWFVVATGVPLCYLQVFVVDLGWSGLEQWGFFQRLVERTRTRAKWAQRLLASRGSFWVTFGATPFLGPWMVMALMRLAGVPHRHIALALALSLLTTSALLAGACVYVPAWFQAA